MTLVKHELKQGKVSFWIWTASIGFLLAICVFLFPEMKGQMDGISDIFASMGSFTQAFGMDRLNFGTLIGFYAVECGNVLGLGGAFYAALCAVGILSKEEKDKTAEFLLTHPVSRVRIITEKLAAVLIQLTAMNIIIYALAIGNQPDSSGLLSAPAGAGRNLLWHFGVPAQRQRRCRTRYCRYDVFSEPDCKHCRCG